MEDSTETENYLKTFASDFEERLNFLIAKNYENYVKCRSLFEKNYEKTFVGEIIHHHRLKNTLNENFYKRIGLIDKVWIFFQ